MPDTTLPLENAASLDHKASSNSEVFAMTDSPCVAICSTLYDDVCRGCGRTAMEVANWVCLSDTEKQTIWTRIRAEGYPRRP